MSPMISLYQWIQLVERVTGLTEKAALKASCLDQVDLALQRAEVTPPFQHEVVAVVAAELARAIYRIRPLRRMPLGSNTRQGERKLAALTAAELLRSCGCSIDPQGVSELAADIGARASRARLVRGILATTSSPDATLRNAEIYLSVPVSNRSAYASVLVNAWASTIEEELEAVGAELGINLFLRVPGQLDGEPERLLQSIRRGLRQSVLHIVIGAGGGSTGVGREVQSSIARRRPVVWLVPPGERAPRSVLVAATEADVEIVSLEAQSELRGIARTAVLSRIEAIETLMREKDSVPLTILELQDEMRRRWIDIATRDARWLRDALAKSRISVQRANLLLTEPFVLLHETSISEVDAFAAVLGLDPFPMRGDSVFGVDRPGRRAAAAALGTRHQ